MKLVLEVKDEKVPFILEVLRNFKFVKEITPLSEKEEIIEDIKQGVRELNLIRAGKKQAKDAEKFIHELQNQNR